MRTRAAILLGVALCHWTISAAAQEPEFEIADAPPQAWSTQAKLLLRGDHVTGLGARKDLQRAGARLRSGVLYTGEGALRAGAGVLASAGTDANSESLRNNDNHRADALALDTLWVGYASRHLRARAGKQPLGADLSPMLWDDDLRPIGAQLLLQRDVGLLQRWAVGLETHALDHPLGGDARLAVLQGGWHHGEGARDSISVLLSLVLFDNFHGLAADGLGRGNTLAGGRYAEDYRLLDLQLVWRRQLATGPLELRLDLVRNLPAATARDGARASAVFGDRRLPGQWEFGYAFQRAQRDAVLAATSSDDWWFHSGARGHMPWIGRGLGDDWSLRLAAFLERRDGLQGQTRRVLLDLERRW